MDLVDQQTIVEDAAVDSGSKKPKVEPQKVPRRPYGTLVKNHRLPNDVPIIGLGCSSFSTFFWSAKDGNDTTTKFTPETLQRTHPIVQEWIQTIKVAVLDYGITLLDTAPWYGHGTSEIVIGWAMEELLLQERNKGGGSTTTNNGLGISRNDIIINTKIGRYEENPNKQFDFSTKTTIESVERSIKRMKCQYINVLQLHDPEFAPSLTQLLKETIPAMIKCRSKGYCKALGMTGYPLEIQYQILQCTLEECSNKEFECDATTIWDQALTYGHFNLHDRSLVSQPIFKKSKSSSDDDINSSINPDDKKDGGSIAYESYAQYCKDHSIGLLAAAPLSMGLLTNQGPPVWHPANPTTELAKACKEAVKICDDHNDNVNISTIATIMALSNPQTIPGTLLGMKNVTEVKRAADAANRFHHTTTSTNAESSASSWNESSNILLKQVLTEAEYKVWEILNDAKDGPFASIWKDNTADKWDGIQGVKDFWEQLDNKYKNGDNDDGAFLVVENWQATSM